MSRITKKSWGGTRETNNPKYIHLCEFKIQTNT